MEKAQKIKTFITLAAGALLTTFALGLLWFFLGSTAPVGAGWYLFSFAAGLTMIVLPCTLPLAFVIVPLTLGKGPGKGLAIALAFGLGVAITLSMYGVLAAIVGSVAIGSLGAPLETVKNWLYFIVGAFAYLFALGEIGLLNVRMPTYTGAAPAFIEKQKEILKAFFMGMFLGNIGVGCPHPATPVIFTHIAVSGNVFYGWLLFLVHAIGRVLPLLLLAILGIMGVDALNWLVERRVKVERATGWGMVIVSAFILVLGLFTHDWWVYSGQHTILEEITQEERFLGFIVQRFNLADPPHGHGIPTGTGLMGLPLSIGNLVLALLWIIPLWWYYKRKRREIVGLPPEKKMLEEAAQPYRFWFLVVLSALILVLTTWALPERFRFHAMMGEQEHMVSEVAPEVGMMAMDEGAPHETAYHEEGDVIEGLAVNLSASPASASAGIPERLSFFINDKPEDTPVTDLEISHERLMHVIGVRSDMNEFFHIHPVPTTASGVLTVTQIFEKPGTYKIWSEVTRNGTGHVIGHPLLEVFGAGETYEKTIAFGRSVIADAYQVLLNYEGSLVQGQESRLTFEIHDAQGGEVSVEPYLGADMHLLIIKDDLSEFIHAHSDSGPMHSRHPRILPQVFANGDDHAEGTDHGISFQVSFPTAGIYRAYAQFRPKGSTLPEGDAITASFWMEAGEKPPFPFNPWWFLLTTSLLAIGLLSYFVRRYLRVEAVHSGVRHE